VPTNETVVEVVRFTEKGVSDVAARTKAMGNEVDEAVKKQKTLLGLLADPRYAKHQQRVAGMRQQYELMALRARNVAAAAGLADGSTARQIRAVARLNDQYARLQRTAQLTARYGDRLGGFLARYGGSASKIGGMVGLGLTGVAGVGAGLARQGFQGTVEQNRLDAETNRISREMAGAFKPVMDLFTRGARAVRERLERTSEGGQNALLAGTAVAGTAAGVMALRGAAQLIGAVAGDTMATKFRGMALRGAAGMAGAGMLGYGVGTGSVASGAIGGAMLGFSVGGPKGAVVGAVAGGSAAHAQNLPNAQAGESPWEYYARRRAAGGTMFGASIDTLTEGVSETWKWATVSGHTHRGPSAEAEAARRNVTLAGGGFEATGSAYDRLSAGIERVEGADAGGSGVLAAAMRALAETIRAATEAGRAPLRRPGEPGF
jgi:hypothetical protein